MSERQSEHVLTSDAAIDDIVIGHVAMSCELYATLTKPQRERAWTEMIQELSIGDKAFLPVPYVDRSTDTVGLNLVGVPSD